MDDSNDFRDDLSSIHKGLFRLIERSQCEEEKKELKEIALFFINMEVKALKKETENDQTAQG